MATAPKVFDYIVIGGGSAGCVLAKRLSADDSVRVLLLEAGPSDRHWTIRIPGGIRYHQKLTSRFNWHYFSEPQTFLESRRIYQPRGRVLGGSSSINGMVFIRGNRLDYDRWVEEGARGWSYEDVLPYFKRLESFEGPGNGFRGTDGPVQVRRQEKLIELDRLFLEAGEAAGFPYTEDPNGSDQEGFCRFDMNVERGIRASSSWAYLNDRKTAGKLTVLSSQTVRRIEIKGHRGVAVKAGDRTCDATYIAEREIILCAGAFGSPQILMQSGVGPSDHLKACGISPLVDLPGVGQNLQDHLEIHVQHKCRKRISLNGYLTPIGYLHAGFEWLVYRRGVAARSQMNVGAFLRSGADVIHPDVQFHFFPVFFDDRDPVPGVHGYRLGAGPIRPESRGTVTLDPSTSGRSIVIDPRYLPEQRDREEMRAAFELARLTLSQESFKEVDAGEVRPGPAVTDRPAIDEYIRRTASSGYHPCGTCKMGDASDAMTVVDPLCRVKGLAGLRVVDASIMPSLVSGNTNAAVMMIAERAADLIKRA